MVLPDRTIKNRWRLSIDGAGVNAVRWKSLPAAHPLVVHNSRLFLVGAVGVVLLARRYVGRLLIEVPKRLNNLSESDALAQAPGRCKVKLLSEEFGRLDEAFAEARYRLLQECERRWQLERRKLKADRLAASVALASSFAHEIRTPLGVIR
jgi:signal transduction histidine kinase